MKPLPRTCLSLTALAFAFVFTAPVIAGSLDTREFKVIGQWTSAPNFKAVDKPFWTKELPEASNGALKGHIAAVDELGISGYEVGRLLKLGLFDFVHGGFTYVAGDNPVLEGVDLSGVMQDWDTAKKAVEAYRPVLAEAIKKTFNAKLLMIYSDPTQVFYCRVPVTKIDDFKGKKVRVYNKPLADLVNGLGGIPTTIDFAEVVPALQRGVVDCAVTGTLSGYTAKWYEVATHMYTIHAAAGTSLFLAVSNATWNRLNATTQKFLLEQVAKLEKKAWDFIVKADQEGINCNTGAGPCTIGEQAEMTLVTPTEADLETMTRVVEQSVLANWAKRCGAECAERWNATVGKVVGVKAAAQ